MTKEAFVAVRWM